MIRKESESNRIDRPMKYVIVVTTSTPTVIGYLLNHCVRRIVVIAQWCCVSVFKL